MSALQKEKDIENKTVPWDVPQAHAALHIWPAPPSEDPASPRHSCWCNWLMWSQQQKAPFYPQTAGIHRKERLLMLLVKTSRLSCFQSTNQRSQESFWLFCLLRGIWLYDCLIISIYQNLHFQSSTQPLLVQTWPAEHPCLPLSPPSHQHQRWGRRDLRQTTDGRLQAETHYTAT